MLRWVCDGTANAEVVSSRREVLLGFPLFLLDTATCSPRGEAAHVRGHVGGCCGAQF